MKKETLVELIGMAVNGGEECSGLPFEIGSSYFIRTVTYHVVGEVKEIKGPFLVLSEASWVADSGRFSKAISEGELSEVEYVGKMIVNTTSISDACEWKHNLPKVTK